MYCIHNNTDHLLVEFLDNFDFSAVQTIIHHETMLNEYPDTNDIWLIGRHHADIRLGELETMVNEFQCRCPSHATRTQTAVVVNEGLTGSILELWVKALRKHVTFDIRIFHTLAEAQCWLDVADSKVA